MEVSKIGRVFKYNGDVLDDIPGLPEREVMKVYANKYPELVNATCRYNGINEDHNKEYSFTTTTGTKG